ARICDSDMSQHTTSALAGAKERGQLTALGLGLEPAQRNQEGGRMDYRRLGTSGLKVSPLCLGTMMFGAATDEPTAARIIARAREQGVNFIDTADVYAGGKSEEIVGRAIAAERDWWVLATKLGNATGQ